MRTLDHPIQTNQQNQLIQNLPINDYKTTVPHPTQREIQQPGNLVHGPQLGTLPVNVITADTNRALGSNIFPQNGVYYSNPLPQFIPTTSNIPNSLYPNSQIQYVPLNCNPQNVFTPYYQQPQRLPQSNLPVIYQMGTPTSHQNSQIHSGTLQEVPMIKTELLLPNSQGSASSNRSHSSESSSNVSKTEHESTYSVSNTNKILSKAGNFIYETSRNESANPSIKHDERKMKNDKEVNPQNIYLARNNFNLSGEHRKEQGSPTSFTTELQSGSKVPRNASPILQSPWIATRGTYTPSFVNPPNVQPVINPPVQIVSQHSIEFANTMSQPPYVVGLMYPPSQTVTMNYIPTIQTNSFIYNPALTNYPTMSEVSLVHQVGVNQCSLNTYLKVE